MISAVWDSHSPDYYEALKRKGVLTPATTRTSLEDACRVT